MSPTSDTDLPRTRARQMLSRLSRELERGPTAVGLEPGLRRWVLGMAEAALMFRAGRLDDAHDHRLLHPARTLIVLLEVGGARPDILATAPLLDSRFPDLIPPWEVWSEGLEGNASRIVEISKEIPRPGWRSEGPDDALLLEALVTLSSEELRLALCEMLDQLRHLHVEPDHPALARGVELARQIYTPLAVRLAKSSDGGPGAALLARRFNRWQERLARVVGK